MDYVSKRHVMVIAGSFIALMIGSGFATGQELLQYFVAYGAWGILGAMAVLLLMTFAGISFTVVGHAEKFDQGTEIFAYFCGPRLGAFYDTYTILFTFLSYVIMIGGAAYAGAQQFDWPPAVGGSLMVLLTVLFVVSGLKTFVSIISIIEPLIIVAALFLGIFTLIHNWQEFLVQLAGPPPADMLRASANWFLAALSYVGFCILCMAAFMAQSGKDAHSAREGQRGALLGSLAYCGAVILLTMALMSRLVDVAGTEVPSLILANRISPGFGSAYSLIMFVGILTTAAPRLWITASRYAREGTARFRLLAVVLGTVGGTIGIRLKFSQLVNVIYVLTGYLGILLLLIMVVHMIRHRGMIKQKSS